MRPPFRTLKTARGSETDESYNGYKRVHPAVRVPSLLLPGLDLLYLFLVILLDRFIYSSTVERSTRFLRIPHA